MRPSKPMGFMIDFNNSSPVFSNGLRSLHKKSSRINYFRYLSFRQLYISWHIVLIAFLSLVVCLVVNNNSLGKLSELNILALILKVVPSLFFYCSF